MINRKSLIYWLIVIVFLIALGGIWAVFYFQTENEDSVYLANQNSNLNNSLSNTNTTPEYLDLVAQTIDDFESLTLGICVDDLFSDDYNRFETLSDSFAELHPELQAISAGSACKLSNDMEIVTFSHQNSIGTSGQTIVVFDSDGDYVNETEDFYCSTLGDLLAPHIKSLETGNLNAYCWSGDGAIGRYEEFEVSLNDFSFSKTISEEGGNVKLEDYIISTDEAAQVENTEIINNPTITTLSYSKQFTESESSETTTQNEFSIASEAKIKEPSGITLRNVKVALYDSELLDTQYGAGRVSDIKCNDDYCLMTIRSAGWQYRVLRFENGKFTDLSSQISGFEPGNISQISFVWNGSYWLVAARDHLFKYNGHIFTEVDIDSGVNQKVSTMAWNGSYWLVAIDMVCCLNKDSELIHMDNNLNITKRISILEDLTYPHVYSIAWGNNAWVIGASEQNDKASKKRAKLLKYSGEGDPDDISDLLPNIENLRFEHLFWNGSEWLMNFLDIGASNSSPLLYSYNGKKITDISNKLLGFDNTSISTIDGRPFYYTIAGYIDHVANVIINGVARDLSDYFSMGVYSGTVQGNNIVVGGEGMLEILSFGYESSRVYTSDAINDSGTVISATLVPSQQTPAGTSIKYKLSNDNGVSWYDVTAGEKYTFSQSGSFLRWQAELTSNSDLITPSISSIEIQYDKQ